MFKILVKFSAVAWYWRFIFAWFVLSIAVLASIGSWSSVYFAIVWCVVFGGASWLFRERIRDIIKGSLIDNIVGFSIIVIIISSVEEYLVYILGGTLAQPVLWVDLVFIDATWLTWLVMWKLWVSRKFAFSPPEAVLYSAFTGVLYEIFVSGAFLHNPFSIFIELPVVWIVYSVIVFIPITMIDFRGKSHGVIAGIEAVLVPFLISEAVAASLWVLLGVLKAPLV